MSHDRIIGTAAASLAAGTFSRNRDVARLGATAEQLTAGDLVGALGDGRVIMHDLRLPGSRLHGNIDHAIVAGTTVLPIDSKWWAGGVYWTLGGVTRRGLTAVPFADKDTASLTRSTLAGYLDGATVLEPLVVVWGKSGVTHRLGLYRPRGARAITGERLLAVIRSRLPDAHADAGVVHDLAKLVVDRSQP